MFLEEELLRSAGSDPGQIRNAASGREGRSADQGRAASFGFSRPAFYKAQRDFTHQGLAGLIPRRRGPKGGHKVTREMVSFAERIHSQEPALGTPELVRRIQKEFSVRCIAEPWSGRWWLRKKNGAQA